MIGQLLLKTCGKTRENSNRQIGKACCPAKVIMSYFTNLEMSSFRGAKMPFVRGGHRGKRGHGYGESGRVKAVIRGSEGAGEVDQAGGGGRGSGFEFAAGSEDSEAGGDRGGQGGHPSIEGEVFESGICGFGQGSGDRVVPGEVWGVWSDAGGREAFGGGWD